MQRQGGCIYDIEKVMRDYIRLKKIYGRVLLGFIVWFLVALVSTSYYSSRLGILNSAKSQQTKSNENCVNCSEFCRKNTLPSVSHCCGSQRCSSVNCSDYFIKKVSNRIRKLKVEFWLSISQLFISAMLTLIVVKKWYSLRSRALSQHQVEERRINFVNQRLPQAQDFQLASIHIQLSSQRSLRMESFSSDNQNNCSIYCDALNQRHIIRLECQHCLHSDCIRRWYKAQPKCPLRLQRIFL